MPDFYLLGWYCKLDVAVRTAGQILMEGRWQKIGLLQISRRCSPDEKTLCVLTPPNYKKNPRILQRKSDSPKSGIYIFTAVFVDQPSYVGLLIRL